MGIAVWIGVLGFLGTLLLVLVGLMNFSVFRKQLRSAREQIEHGIRHLEIAQQQPGPAPDPALHHPDVGVRAAAD